jgi:fibronectin type 3 domain-containing protein
MVPKKPKLLRNGALSIHGWASLLVAALLTGCGNPVATTSSSLPTGTATLSWTAPTQNTDGTPIMGLAGYRVYYGTDSNNLTQFIDITDTTSVRYVFTGLAAGTYYFAVSAYNGSGFESARSNVASKTI